MGEVSRPALLRQYDPEHNITLWLAFPQGTSLDEARSEFRKTYGYTPPAVRTYYAGLVLAGPVVTESSLAGGDRRPVVSLPQGDGDE